MSDREDYQYSPEDYIIPRFKAATRFEPRYIDMVSRSMREDSEFGIILSREGTDPKMLKPMIPERSQKLLIGIRAEMGF